MVIRTRMGLAAACVHVAMRVLVPCVFAALATGCVVLQPGPAPAPQAGPGAPWHQLAYPMRGYCHGLRYFDRNCRRRAAPSTSGQSAQKDTGSGSSSSGSSQQGDSTKTSQSTQTSR